MKQEQYLLMEFLLIFIVTIAWATYTKKMSTYTKNKTNPSPTKKKSSLHKFISWQVLLLRGSTAKQVNIERAFTEALGIAQFNLQQTLSSSELQCLWTIIILEQWSQFTLTKSDVCHLDLNLEEKCISISGKYLNSQKPVVS